MDPHDSNDTNLSYSETTPTAKGKYTRNQYQLKKDLAETCRVTIDEKMSAVHDTLTKLMEQQDLIMHNFRSSPHQPPQSIPYPSPIPDATPSKNVTFTNKPHKNTPPYNSFPRSTLSPKSKHPSQQQYQRSGTLLFIFQGDEYELRDGQYTKNDTTLRDVDGANDLLLYYQEMQSEALAYNIMLENFDQLQPWKNMCQILYLQPVCL